MQDSMPEAERERRAVVVGGSLAGLMTALTLARTGWRVTVLERSTADRPSGAAIRVDADLIERLTGLESGVTAADRSGLPQSWSHVHDRLRTAVTNEPRIDVRYETRVAAVDADDTAAWAVTDTGDVVRGNVLVGADGHRSIVRRRVAPDRPDARYAGYTLWIGIAEEASLPDAGRWPADVAFLDADDGILLGYPLPGADGSLAPGTRRLGWAWFDPTRNDLLRARGHVVGTVVHHSMTPADVPPETLRELAEAAPSRWRRPWSDAVLDVIDRRAVTGTPIAEYLPDRLVDGRLVLVGDAGHVPTPMTGTGFNESLHDAEVLARELQGAGIGEIVAALRRYEESRLPDVREMVRMGRDFSESFVSAARSHSAA